MKKAIYPIKFIPQPRERVWGGRRLAAQFHKPFDPDAVIGESWEVSGFEDDSSVIENGWLEDNPLFDVIETYMDEIVGEDNYKRFGNEFPVLVKLLDIQERLSVQVHPDDETAFDRHNSYGKTEAWYVLEADPTARIYMGFNKDLDMHEFLDRCAAGTLEEVLNVVRLLLHRGGYRPLGRRRAGDSRDTAAFRRYLPHLRLGPGEQSGHGPADACGPGS